MFSLCGTKSSDFVFKIWWSGEYLTSFWRHFESQTSVGPMHISCQAYSNACRPPASRRGNEITATTTTRGARSLRWIRTAAGGAKGQRGKTKDAQVMRIDGIWHERWQLYDMSVTQLPTASDQLSVVEYEVWSCSRICTIKRRWKFAEYNINRQYVYNLRWSIKLIKVSSIVARKNDQQRPSYSETL